MLPFVPHAGRLIMTCVGIPMAVVGYRNARNLTAVHMNQKKNAGALIAVRPLPPTSVFVCPVDNPSCVLVGNVVPRYSPISGFVPAADCVLI